MALHHMCILHTSAGVTIKSSALSLVCVNHISLLSRPCSPSPPIAFLTVFARACMQMTSIWWIKSNALIPWQTRPMLHVRNEMPCVRNGISACVTDKNDRQQCSNRVLSADPRLPPKPTSCRPSLCSLDVAIKIPAET